MRTTLDLDDDLMIRAKVRAAERRTSLKSVFEDALRASLGPSQRGKAAVVLPSWDGGGLPPGVDWTSNAAMTEYLDRVEGATPVGPS